MLTDEYRYIILKLVEAKPDISQRELARELGISLGKTNFCLKALMEKGLLKASNFRNNKNKLVYIYILTPKGLEEKANVTIRFLQRKVQEYEKLQLEIEQLKIEIEAEQGA
ncbi:MarR family EPS-associated transcriptional regulator [Methylomarinum vadi]|uniref:MarR family EPS-associated transcriptional regulator n=1 Tax=Methylomarinum vadi TaxID=438855 RepID=UPI0004DF1F0E|nr:MarR family EPS-associated transcriptional regulator [Methylomarinum vadi]